MTESGADIDIQQLWAEINQLLREGPVNRPLWDAAEAAKPLVLEDDLLVLGLTAPEMRHASYLETEINRARLREILHARTGRHLDLRVITGSTPEDWERAKERERSAEQRMAGAVRQRTAARGVELIWDQGNQQVFAAMAGTRAAAYPTVKARLLAKVFPLVSEIEEKARSADAEAEEIHQRHLNRILDRIATHTDIPPTVVALEYLRYAASHKRGGG